MVSRSPLPLLSVEMRATSASSLPATLTSAVPPRKPLGPYLAPPRPAQPSIDHLPQTEFFRDLLPNELVQVAREMQRVPCSHRQVLCREGEPISRMILVHSGWVKSTKLSAGGEEVIVGLNGPGTFVVGLGLRPGTPSPSTAQVLEPGHALVWDAAKLDDFCERFPVLRRNTARILAERLRSLEQRFHQLATEQVPARLASLLIDLAGQIGSRVGDTVRVSLSREELAQMTGTTLFTVSRLLSQWTDRGIVDARRRAVFILNVPLLLTVARGC